MSAKPCREETCTKLVLFGKDEETMKWQVLNNQVPMWRVVRYEKDGTPILKRVHDTFISHFVNCAKPNKFSGGARQAEPPPPELHFSEPKELFQ
jgi:hypothetical protein